MTIAAIFVADVASAAKIRSFFQAGYRLDFANFILISNS